MALFENVLPASFDGVSFLVEGISTSGGIKHVKHTYPNSNNQNIEKLGRKQRPYQVRALITGDDDYAQKRDLLLSKLESSITGVLVHPFHGVLNNMVAVDYNLDEDFTSLGVARISITFEVDLPESVPQPSNDSLLSLISVRAANVSNVVNEDFVETYSVFGVSGADIVDAIDKGRAVASRIEDASSIFTQATLQVNSFTDTLSTFAADIVAVVQRPIDFVDSFDGLIASYDGLFTSAEASFEALKELFGFGDDDGTDDLPTDTQSYLNRITNRRSVNNAVQVFALNYGYQVAAQIPFETVAQQDEVLQTLEVQYQKLYAVPEINFSVKIALQELRDTSQEHFDNQRNPPPGSDLDVDVIPLKRNISIHSFETSARLLSHQYYGDSSAGESIALLNKENDASFISGDLEIFTS